MLHNRRRRLADIAQREAAGESFWTDEFSEPLRIRFQQIMGVLSQERGDIDVEARRLILFDEGWTSLVDDNYGEIYDYRKYMVSAPDDMMPTVLEAWYFACQSSNVRLTRGNRDLRPTYEKLVNNLLREHRLSFEMVKGEMVPFSSRELHVEVVEPTLRLLSEPTWAPVEAAYQKALSELSRGDAADAVTDAGTALQEALTLLGCDGNALGPLIKSAKQKKILSAHDAPMLEAIEKVFHWVSADRSASGDGHNSSPAELEDAWFIIHVVGAILVRVSKQTSRP
ncbi:hypothetical protein N1028_02370 [Herbiconiux sp. CPCC 203407]|uniref:Uncharacterized protein n=1 Tax=Herbiconiux oxytropis TaxID=2970915 RepID=A0AA41XAL9_9MICO|nr:hypothetical protein [Herbiconiux oxytropis]MCS5721082.1 hypothetical protein [Herbiconiux oxytropis]MCS5724734.1 hypothetical protein [Herbiconiux oxytropis]